MTAMLRSFPFRSLLAPALAVGALVGLAGCGTPAYNDPARTGPFFTPANHAGEPSLGGLRRVVLLPIAAGSLAPQETVAEVGRAHV